MATLPAEQVTQRNGTAAVGITYDTRLDSPGELLWMSTTTLPYTVVVTKDVAGDQLDRDVLEARILAAGLAAYDDYDVSDYGTTNGYQPLVSVGAGTLAISLANSQTKNTDLSIAFDGGRGTIVYTKGTVTDATSVLIGTGAAKAVITGSYVATTAHAVNDGTATFTVTATDADGATATCAVTVTVA